MHESEKKEKIVFERHVVVDTEIILTCNNITTLQKAVAKIR